MSSHGDSSTVRSIAAHCTFKWQYLLFFQFVKGISSIRSFCFLFMTLHKRQYGSHLIIVIRWIPKLGLIRSLMWCYFKFSSNNSSFFKVLVFFLFNIFAVSISFWFDTLELSAANISVLHTIYNFLRIAIHLCGIPGLLKSSNVAYSLNFVMPIRYATTVYNFPQSPISHTQMKSGLPMGIPCAAHGLSTEAVGSSVDRSCPLFM